MGIWESENVGTWKECSRGVFKRSVQAECSSGVFKRSVQAECSSGAFKQSVQAECSSGAFKRSVQAECSSGVFKRSVQAERKLQCCKLAPTAISVALCQQRIFQAQQTNDTGQPNHRVLAVVRRKSGSPTQTSKLQDIIEMHEGLTESSCDDDDMHAPTRK
jgi:hypothetical protein